MSVWHAWQGEDEALLAKIAAGYSQATIELVNFGEEHKLQEALRAAAQQGGGPDLFLGPDRWSDELLELGLIDAYCLPDGCEPCFTENPPRWCTAALGDFNVSLNLDFQVAGLCEPEQCPPCYSESQPRWCWAAALERARAPDMFQAGLARPFDKEVYPVGIPLHWDFVAIAANTEWFVERDMPLPTSLEEILQLHEQHKDFVYLEPSLLQDPTPTTADWFIEEIAAGDPSPQPAIAAMLVFPARAASAIASEVETLLQIPMSDYQPEPQVQAVYLNTQTQQPALARDFAHAIAAPDTQVGLYQEAGRLPAHKDAWGAVADQELVHFGWQSWLSFTGQLIELDPRDFVQRPEVEFDLGADACAEAGEELYRQLTAHGVHEVRAGGQAAVSTSICRSHTRQLEDELGLGDDACSEHVRGVFAQRLMELRGVTGAVYEARAAAEQAWEECTAS